MHKKLVSSKTGYHVLGRFIFFLTGLNSCTNNAPSKTAHIFDTGLEHHLISSGDNRPDFNLYKDSVDYFLNALHVGMSPEAFAEAAGWTDSMLQKKIQLLQNSGFLNKADGEKLVPTCMVFIQETGKQFYTLSEKAAQEIADSIQQLIHILKQHKSEFEDGYKLSVYSKQHSFAEYFMWFYHFIYTRATDILYQRGATVSLQAVTFFTQENIYI